MERRSRIPNPGPIAVLLILFCVLSSYSADAQQELTVDDVVAIALNGNPDVQISRLQKDYYEKLKKTSFDLDQTSIGIEYGQMNSMADDSKLAITQAVQFPTVYVNQNKLNKSNVHISEVRLKLNESQLKAEVKRRFFELVILGERISLLKTADSIYTQFLHKTERRFSLGDVDVLENSTALHQHQQSRNQLNQAMVEQEVRMLEFQILLGTEETIELQNGALIYPIESSDTSIAEAPSIKLHDAVLNQRQIEHKLERSKLLPELSFGYNNLSLIGFQQVGTDEHYFNSNDRFTYWSFGMNIPIFNWAQRARIQASKFRYKFRTLLLYPKGEKLKLSLVTRSSC